MIKIFYLSLNTLTPQKINYLKKFVSIDTLNQVKNYKSQAIQQNKIIGEAMIRILLEKYFGIKDANIKKTIYGKPYVDNNNVFFNISHSGEYIICAISNQQIGVDIEKIGKNKMHVAHRFFHINEINILKKLNEKAQTNVFFKLWSAKESYIKYTGSGLSTPLSDFEIVLETQQAHIQQNTTKIKVHLQECHIDNEYYCFICSDSLESTYPELFPINII